LYIKTRHVRMRKRDPAHIEEHRTIYTQINADSQAVRSACICVYSSPTGFEKEEGIFLGGCAPKPPLLVYNSFRTISRIRRKREHTDLEGMVQPRSIDSLRLCVTYCVHRTCTGSYSWRRPLFPK
jgi:hypothetical protein